MSQFDLKRICQQFVRRPIRGLIHIGACTGEERDVYQDLGITPVFWVEGNPATYAVLAENVRAYDGHHAICAMIGADIQADRIVDFYITSNMAPGLEPDKRHASSSLLPLARHLDYYPHIQVTDTIQVAVTTLDALLAAYPDMRQCNMMVLDVQGAEMLALRGASACLTQCDYLCIEVNVVELYQGCVLLPELSAYLEQHGFIPMHTQLTSCQWGDAFYRRQGMTDVGHRQDSIPPVAAMA